MNEGLFKRIGFGALRLSGALAIAEHRVAGVPVLAYHGVTATEHSALRNLRRLHVSASLFEEHLKLLREKWRPVSLSAVREAVIARRPLPSRSVAVTFDDGYRNILNVALPLLRRYEMPACVFVLTTPTPSRLWMDRLEAAVIGSRHAEVRWGGHVYSLTSEAARHSAIQSLSLSLEGLGPKRDAGLEHLLRELGRAPQSPDDDRDLLAWDEIRALKEAGLEIGSHASFHEPLTEFDEQVVSAMLLKSRADLERELGPGPFSFAYPWGAWSRRLADDVRRAGFACAVTTDAGLNGTDADLFGLRRFLIGADDNVTRLRTALSGLRALWGRP